METKRKMLETNACKCKAAKSKKRFLLTKFVQIPNENGKCLCRCRWQHLVDASQFSQLIAVSASRSAPSNFNYFNTISAKIVFP